ncbi:MAG: saccharopine dehydrogenase C-terminal domain-containing protein [Patescibacteria group bacterium]|jgi:lysine 6-dehydrogenase
MTSKKRRYALVGAGLQGQAIAYDLLQDAKTSGLTIVDRDLAALKEIGKHLRCGSDCDHRVALIEADCRDQQAMAEIFRGHDVVIAAASYELNLGLMQAAFEAGAHFCDLGGNNDVVERQFALDDEAKRRGLKAVPDCGVAPGAVSIITRLGIDRLGQMPDTVKIRVGGLPASPEGLLKYALAFSVRGLFNECLEPTEILRGGQLVKVPSLTGLERQRFEGLGALEAAFTSGGSSTLAKTFAGLIENLDYKTLRYPGHWRIWTMLRELGYLGEQEILVDGAAVNPRRLSEALFEKILPHAVEDLLVLRVILKHGRQEVRYDMIDRRSSAAPGHSAMQRTTGYSAAIIAKMLATGEIADLGVLRQELSVPAARFAEEWRARGLILQEIIK